MATNALSLFAIEEELQAWSNTLEVFDGNEAVAAEIQQKFAEWLTRATEKRDRFGQFLAHLEHLQELAKEEKVRLDKRTASLEKIQARLEAYAVATMHTLEVRKLEGNTSTLRLAKNTDSVDILDASQVPEMYLHPQKPAPTREPDKMAIKRAIKAGEVVPGADLRVGSDRLERT